MTLCGAVRTGGRLSLPRGGCGPFSTSFNKSAGFHQHAPSTEADVEKTFALVARIIDDPGAMMDDNVLAEDDLFEFTICETYDEFNCK
jgi:hypothetical protein